MGATDKSWAACGSNIKIYIDGCGSVDCHPQLCVIRRIIYSFPFTIIIGKALPCATFAFIVKCLRPFLSGSCVNVFKRVPTLGSCTAYTDIFFSDFKFIVFCYGVAPSQVSRGTNIVPSVVAVISRERPFCGIIDSGSHIRSRPVRRCLNNIVLSTGTCVNSCRCNKRT